MDDPRGKILLVGGEGHPSGVPSHICQLAAALSDIGQVSVASEADKGGYSTLAAAGATHHVVPGLKSGLWPHRLWIGSRGLMRCVKSRGWRVVWLHARLPGLIGRLALALRIWRPVPGTHVVQTYHGLPFGKGHRAGFSKLSRAIEKMLLSACPPLDLIFLTPPQADRMRDAMGARRMARHRVHILGNGSNLGRLPKTPPHKPGRHLIMTGRSGYQKNYPLAVRVFAHLPDDCHLTLCGSGTERADVQKRLRRLAGPAAARIQFKGPVRDVRPLLMGADAYMLTSRYEGLPIGALEAFEVGLPLILSQFETSGDFLQSHPLALRLALTRSSLKQDAGEIDRLLATFCADREAYVTRIRALWQAQWSGHVFERQARALVTGWI
ncbi:glycosyltransferase family 4 protein [Roseovarius sp. M141]|nr:glycosyltransferase family 4 protein [Roseovarius sp. M141]MCQ0090556.1 glycosyltransferase family 4 protein [Roseovarius sp. M141]